MKENQHIDKVFRNKLKDFQQTPPRGAWEKVSSGIASATSTSNLTTTQRLFANRFVRFGIIAGAAAIVIGLLIGIINNSSDNSLIVEKEKSKISERKSNIEEQIVDKTQTQQKQNSDKQDSDNQSKAILIVEEKPVVVSNNVDIPIETNNNVNKNENDIFIIPEIETKKQIEKQVIQSGITDANSLAINNNIKKVKPQFDNTLIETKPKIDYTIHSKQPKDVEKNNSTKPQELIAKQKPKQDNPVNDPPKTEDVVDKTNPPPVKPLPPSIDRSEYPWSIGGYFTKDYIFNSADSESDIKNNYSLDILASYKLKNYTFQSGIGIDISEDNWDYLIKYKRNEVLGTYDNVDSVFFTTAIDSFGNVIMVPHFITSTETVYDSINHTFTDKSNNHYYYLHIPLIAGYKLKSYNNWNVMVKGGAMYSLLIHKKEPTINYYDVGVRVTSIDDRKLIRVKTNLHLLLGFEFEYMISEKFSFSFEPVMEYFVKSIYNSNNITAKQPFSAGLRAGLIYNINN